MFTENPTVRDFVFDCVASLDVQGLEGAELPRHTHEVLLEAQLRAALIRLRRTRYAQMKSSLRCGASCWKLRTLLIQWSRMSSSPPG